MRPPINAEILPRLGYPEMISGFCDAISKSFDLLVEDILRIIVDTRAIHKVNVATGIRYGTISIQDLIHINDICFEGHPFKITHSLRFYDGKKMVIYANDAVTYSMRNHFHEEVLVNDHRNAIYELNLPITLDPVLPTVVNHPQELFLWLEDVIRDVDHAMPGSFSSVYGVFDFEDPYAPLT